MKQVLKRLFRDFRLYYKRAYYEYLGGDERAKAKFIIKDRNKTIIPAFFN